MTSQFDAIKTYHDRRAAWQALNQKPPVVRRASPKKGIGFGRNNGTMDLAPRKSGMVITKPSMAERLATRNGVRGL